MPQTYIRTVSGGSNGTTARAAVSYRRTRSDSREPQAGPALVPDVDRQQHRGERLHADRVLQRAAVERAQVRDADRDLHQGATGVVVVAEHHDVALHVVVELTELGRGNEVERGADLRVPEQRLDLGGDRAVRRQDRVELLA